MLPNQSQQPAWISASTVESADRERAFFRSVYSWMFGGLLLTALASMWVVSSVPMQKLVLGNPIIFIVLCVAEHMRFQFVKEMRPAKLKRILARETFPDELELHRIDCGASHRNLENYEFLKAKAAELPPEVVKPAPLLTGRDLLARALRKHSLPVVRLTSDQLMADVAADLKYPTLDALYVAIGESQVSPQSIVSRLTRLVSAEAEEEAHHGRNGAHR